MSAHYRAQQRDTVQQCVRLIFSHISRPSKLALLFVMLYIQNKQYSFWKKGGYRAASGTHTRRFFMCSYFWHSRGNFKRHWITAINQTWMFFLGRVFFFDIIFRRRWMRAMRKASLPARIKDALKKNKEDFGRRKK